MLKDYIERLEGFEQKIKNSEYTKEDERNLYELEEQIEDEIEFYGSDIDKGYFKLLKRIEKTKKKLVFFAPEAELDIMFPNRHDDDFDEDSMSYGSVFGDD